MEDNAFCKIQSNNKKGKKRPKKPKRPRCSHPDCRKKLALTDSACRCGGAFCRVHRLPEDHICSFNFKDFDKSKFAAAAGLGGGAPSKLVTI